ncbi:Hypothetical_protein [Hexamita inflata]|uniref:Hypothetical_protein n=1 Tax=Hexamita inflata TaxID=28002 RepID=A0AA86TUQ4_9EUKA|nr:Hypothetical protein HINF_LOCUS17220 [Hexamita inflata]
MIILNFALHLVYPITSPLEFMSMLPDRDYYLESDLDFQNTTFIQIPRYAGTLYGNNHTIRNIRLPQYKQLTQFQSTQNIASTQYLSVSLFQNLDNASFTNVQFINIQAQLSSSELIVASFISATGSAKFTGVQITNSFLNVFLVQSRFTLEHSLLKVAIQLLGTAKQTCNILLTHQIKQLLEESQPQPEMLILVCQLCKQEQIRKKQTYSVA